MFSKTVLALFAITCFINVQAYGFSWDDEDDLTCAPPEDLKICALIGPGGDAYGKEKVTKLIDALKGASGANVEAFGDGVGAADVDGFLKCIKDGENAGQKVVALIQAHGDNTKQPYTIQVAPGVWTSTKDLFSKIAEATGGKPIDIFLTSCYGAASADGATLPEGSNLITLSPSDMETSGNDIDRMIEFLKKNAGKNIFSCGLTLLDIYLVGGLKNRINPQIYIPGKGCIDLDAALKSQIGKKFTEEQLKKIHAKLDSLIGAEEVIRIIQLIENSKSDSSIYAVDYGKALAVVLEAGVATPGVCSFPKPK